MLTSSPNPPGKAPPPPPDLRFDQLGLIEPLTAAVRAEGYERPTPIQAHAIPHVLAGKDLLGLAQTGARGGLVHGGY